MVCLQSDGVSAGPRAPPAPCHSEPGQQTGSFVRSAAVRPPRPPLSPPTNLALTSHPYIMAVVGSWPPGASLHPRPSVPRPRPPAGAHAGKVLLQLEEVTVADRLPLRVLRTEVPVPGNRSLGFRAGDPPPPPHGSHGSFPLYFDLRVFHWPLRGHGGIRLRRKCNAQRRKQPPPHRPRSPGPSDGVAAGCPRMFSVPSCDISLSLPHLRGESPVANNHNGVGLNVDGMDYINLTRLCLIQVVYSKPYQTSI